MLEITEITSFEEFIKLQFEWNELLEQCENDSVFLRHEWFKVWWQNFNSNKNLLVILVREKRVLIGIAPLMLVTEKIGNIRPFPSRQIRFIENSVAPHTDFIINNYRIDVLRVIFNHLESIRHKWDIMILHKLPKESLIFSKNPNLYRSGLRFEIQQVINNPVLRPKCEWNSYFSSRSKRVRGAVRNSRTGFKKQVPLTLRILHQPVMLSHFYKKYGT